MRLSGDGRTEFVAAWIGPFRTMSGFQHAIADTFIVEAIGSRRIPILPLQGTSLARHARRSVATVNARMRGLCDAGRTDCAPNWHQLDYVQAADEMDAAIGRRSQ
jgi:hypothetical protein